MPLIYGGGSEGRMKVCFGAFYRTSRCRAMSYRPTKASSRGV